MSDLITVEGVTYCLIRNTNVGVIICTKYISLVTNKIPRDKITYIFENEDEFLIHNKPFDGSSMYITLEYANTIQKEQKLYKKII